MIRHQIYLVLASLATVSSAIRIDWNTNTGPIIPPTATLPPLPKLPFREPASVWESKENDIPNPQPYHYLLPPPSRPKSATDNYARAPVYEQQNYQYKTLQPNYGKFISRNPNSLQSGYSGVPSLAVQYVPNEGLKYFALAPSTGKVFYSKDIGAYDKYNKLNGKYNPKLKKHKAYEKTKFVNYVHYVPEKQQKPQTSYSQQVSTTQQPQYQQKRYTQLEEINSRPQPTKREIFFMPQNVWGSYINRQR